MDNDGTDDFLKILHETEKTNIFVISHKDNLHDKFEQTIRFEKYKDFTRIAKKA